MKSRQGLSGIASHKVRLCLNVDNLRLDQSISLQPGATVRDVLAVIGINIISVKVKKLGEKLERQFYLRRGETIADILRIAGYHTKNIGAVIIINGLNGQKNNDHDRFNLEINDNDLIILAASWEPKLKFRAGKYDVIIVRGG